MALSADAVEFGFIVDDFFLVVGATYSAADMTPAQ